MNIIQNYDIIQQYNILSRKFMDIMESIGNFSEQVDVNVDSLENTLNTLDLNYAEEKK